MQLRGAAGAGQRRARVHERHGGMLAEGKSSEVRVSGQLRGQRRQRRWWTRHTSGLPVDKAMPVTVHSMAVASGTSRWSFALDFL